MNHKLLISIQHNLIKLINLAFLCYSAYLLIKGHGDQSTYGKKLNFINSIDLFAYLFILLLISNKYFSYKYNLHRILFFKKLFFVILAVNIIIGLNLKQIKYNSNYQAISTLGHVNPKIIRYSKLSSAEQLKIANPSNLVSNNLNVSPSPPPLAKALSYYDSFINKKQLLWHNFSNLKNTRAITSLKTNLNISDLNSIVSNIVNSWHHHAHTQDKITIVNLEKIQLFEQEIIMRVTNKYIFSHDNFYIAVSIKENNNTTSVNFSIFTKADYGLRQEQINLAQNFHTTLATSINLFQ